jgi:hypothetical protein
VVRWSYSWPMKTLNSKYIDAADKEMQEKHGPLTLPHPS